MTIKTINDNQTLIHGSDVLRLNAKKLVSACSEDPGIYLNSDSSVTSVAHWIVGRSFNDKKLSGSICGRSHFSFNFGSPLDINIR